MSAASHTRLIRKKAVREFNGRGKIYSWLRAHHSDVARRREVEDRPWSAIVAEMVIDGVRRDDGEEPTVKNVSRIWERVCRDIEIDATAAKPKRKFPSRVSPSWRPEAVAAMPQAGATSSTPTLPARSVAVTGSQARTAMDAPYEFATVDDQGNQLEEGKVFYGGRVRTRQGAEQSERMRRRMKHEDRYR